MLHNGVKHTQELQETKNWKGLPVPRPRRESLNVTSRSPGQWCCSGSASSHETVQRATNELPLPEEPEGWRSYFQCLAADSACWGRLRWSLTLFPARVRPQSHPCLRLKRGAEGEIAPCSPGTYHAPPGHWLLPLLLPPKLSLPPARTAQEILGCAPRENFSAAPLPWCLTTAPNGLTVPNSLSV